MTTKTDSPMQLDKRVPLTWLIGMLGAIAISAISFYIALVRQADAQVVHAQSIVELTKAVQQLTAQINSKSIDDAKRDAMIAENSRNIADTRATLSTHIATTRH